MTLTAAPPSTSAGTLPTTPGPQCSTAPATCAPPNWRSPPSATTTSWFRSPRSASAARTCTTTTPAGTARTSCGNRPCSATRPQEWWLPPVRPARSPLAPGSPSSLPSAAGTCETCRSGDYNICPTGTCFGSPPTHGTMTQYLVAPSRAVHPLPDSIDTVTGSMIEPLAVAVWAVQRAQVGIGHRVLVTGAGPIGLLVTQVARAAGATEITVTDINDDRLAVAAELGATRTINTATTRLGETPEYDRVIECTGHPAGAVVDHPDRQTTRPGHRRRAGRAQRRRPSAGHPAALTRSIWSPHSVMPTPSPSPSRSSIPGAVNIDRIVTGRFGLDGQPTPCRRRSKIPGTSRSSSSRSPDVPPLPHTRSASPPSPSPRPAPRRRPAQKDPRHDRDSTPDRQIR